MHIEQVHAGAFGPFADERLALTEGMTVVWGPNEAGKSSWCAALHAGLCGLRRGRGKRTEERRVEQLRRPRGGADGNAWRVGALVACADGRRIELVHDLENRAHCTATDADLGRDVSAELDYDGTPDGSRLLGLNRDLVPSTLLVRQSDVTLGSGDAEALQQALQRAADTGAEATAHRALECLGAFRREQVGSERAPTKPLMRATRAAESASQQLDKARRAHDDYQQLVARREQAEAEAEAAERKLSIVERALAQRELDELEQRLADARELADRLPAEAPEPTAYDETAQRVRDAVAAYDNRPARPEWPDGPSADELQSRIAELPEHPDGDTELHAEVTSARRAWQRATDAADAHAAQHPGDATTPETGGASAEELRRAAEALEAPVPEIDESLVQQAEAGRTGSGGGRRVGLLVGGGLAAAAAAALLALGQLAPGLGVAVLAVGLSIAGFVAGGGSDADAVALQSRLAVQQERRDDALRRREQAIQQLEHRGLEATAEGARELARRLDDARGKADSVADWRSQAYRLQRERESTAEALRQALADRGVAADEPDVSLEQLADEYEQACRRRAAQARQASERDQLRERLDSRRQADSHAREQAQRRQDAASLVHQAADEVGLAPPEGGVTSPEGGGVEVEGVEPGGAEPGGAESEGAEPELDRLVAALRAWQQRLSEWRQQVRADRADWDRLQRLLGEGDLDELEAEARRRRASLPPAPAQPASGDAGEFTLGDDLEAQRSELELAAKQARHEAAEAAGRVDDRAGNVASVAEAEETAAAAQTELARLRRLDRTLATTEQFLEQASESVHRDVAGTLRATVAEWLPEVTGDRYTEPTVDPESLEVQLKDPAGRLAKATELSHGTSEQLYLLLRLAMTQHLVTTDEPAPLLLDDVTANCDSERTRLLLDLLHRLSEHHQVVLFSQDDAVLDWAHANLNDSPDRLIELANRR
jgi:DNA repair exonuclease SbcCD ATPase subunit